MDETGANSANPDGASISSAALTVDSPEITPHGAFENVEENVSRKSFDQDSGCGDNGQRISGIGGHPPPSPSPQMPEPCMNARAHRRTRAHYDTSGLGTVIRISLSVFRQVRQRTRSHPDSPPHTHPKGLMHPVDPPSGRAGPRFASAKTRLAPRRARPRGGRVHRGVALSRTASTKERTAPVRQ